MLKEFDSNDPPEIAYKKIIKQSQYGDYEVTSSVKNEQVVLKGKRDYSVGILVVLIVVGLLLFLVGLIIAAIYYWTRPYKKIIFEIEPRDTGSSISVRTEGKIDDIAIYEIQKALSSK